MATPTQYYVDPGGGNDTTGDGSIGTPWATVQHALDNITQDTTNGDQINIKAGTADTLSASLSLATYGSPSKVLIFRGYTSAANDGGIGEIDGNGSYSIISTTAFYVVFCDMELHNSGSAAVLSLGSGTQVVNCEIHNTTGSGLIINTFTIATLNYIHNCGTYGINAGSYNQIVANTLVNGTNKFTRAINASLGNNVMGNVVSVDGSSVGIYVARWRIIRYTAMRAPGAVYM
jgi:hypothetical protein